MKKLTQILSSLALVMALPTVNALAMDSGQCKAQAATILSRLQADVVGELDSVQLASANQIVVDVCQTREQQVEAQVEQAVEAAVEETRVQEQEKADSWLTESANKPGNKRLKRKGY